MRYTILFLLALILVPSQAAAAPDKVVKDSITSQNKKRSFYLYAPDSVKSGTPAPLIVLLHGSGHNGLSLVDKWKDFAAKESIIIVGPDSMDPARWASPVDGPDFLHDLVESIKSKYTIDPRRVYLFGHSGGAVFALYMSLFESQYFAATVVHAGALHQRDPAISLAKRKTPIAIFVGTRDPFFPLEDVRGTRDDLNKQGFAVELTEVPGHDHNYYGVASKINQSAWEFLKKHQLNEDPQYEQYNWNK
ncbi:MAG TPA: alpha/beta hydrolase-fold protein [Blastocatellia bacterium]|nr:alpha/beta hydrolase-fold protein [Blastocatellia bacterium]